METVGPKVAVALNQVRLVPLRDGNVRLCFLDNPHGLAVQSFTSRWLVHPLQPSSDRWLEIWSHVATHLGSSLEGWCAAAARGRTTINGWQAMLPSQVILGGAEPKANPVPPPKLEVL